MNKVCLSFTFATLTAFAWLAGCGDDPANVVDGAGGEGGDDGASGSPSGGKASGGSNTGSAGEPGSAGTGAQAGGEGGAAGEPSSTAGAGGEAVSAAGAGGVDTGGGGAGSEITYQCGDSSSAHKLCSGLKAAACTPATDCADCVTARNEEDDPFLDCAACAAVYAAHWQCGIDAFEGGDLAAGFECVPDYGADLSESCYELFFSAYACLDYTIENPCPETWPME